jgi:hypothetical protein
MNLMHEDLARAHARQRQLEAALDARAVRVVRARRAQRRAENANARARRALAIVAQRSP